MIEARADLARIFDFNHERDEAYAERVNARLLARGKALARTPFMGRPLGTFGLRQLSVPDIQYVLVYGVDHGDVLIFRVHSTREDWR
jgi:plasmid stabilization system protein ParE